MELNIEHKVNLLLQRSLSRTSGIKVMITLQKAIYPPMDYMVWWHSTPGWWNPGVFDMKGRGGL